jgi:hypothetical protein
VTRGQSMAWDLANWFARAFERERNLPDQERLELALAEAFDIGSARLPAAAARIAGRKKPKVIDELAELRLQMDAQPIKDQVASAFGLEPGLLIGPAVTRKVRAAQDVMWLRLATELRWSAPKIGRLCALSQMVILRGLKRERTRVAASEQRKERASGT